MPLSHVAIGLGLALLGMSATAGAAPPGSEEPDSRARRLLEDYQRSLRPLEIEVGRLWWEANVSGTDEAYRKKEEAETRLELRLSDAARFAELKSIRQRGLGDPLLARQIALLYLQCLPRQLDPELIKQMLALSNAVEKKFAVHRAKLGGKELTDSEVRKVLRTSTDSAELRAVWEASKRVGPVVAPELKRLVKLRNEAARKLGFADYHVMQLAVGEQGQEQVLRLFDELDALTRDLFRSAKAEIDAALARRCGIPAEQLRPWHYQDPFFQESPDVLGQRFDAIFASIDILKVCREFYAGIGLPVADVLDRSDLYERPGKNPHAFCTDIDRQGDVRVLANIVPNKMWLGTMLHELGHSVYSSKNIPPTLPYLVRTDAHALSTEAVAMMFEQFIDRAAWLRGMGVTVPDPERFQETASRLRRNQLLIFSRWCQVMFRFEKGLYADPDQDLNRLWWDLVERYQEVRRPEGRNEPDYAAKIHIVTAPVYYHNYMLGELFAAQLHHAIARDVLDGADPARAVYVGNPDVGRFMKRRVFEPGRTLDWAQLAQHATGEPLSAKAFAIDIQAK